MKIVPRKTFLPLTRPIFGKEEIDELSDTLNSGWVTLGPKTKKFEQMLSDYIGVKHTIALNSCSAALHLAMVALDIGVNDEVITTPFTFAATVHAILHVGAKPVFVDIDSQTFNIDPQKIEAAITSRTKVILPVHYGGLPVELEIIKKIAKKHKLFIIEDAAFAIGAKYKNKNIGTIGDLTCFSFHPVKVITTGDGGAITTNNKKLAEKLMILRVNGMNKEAWKRHTIAGSWDYSITMQGFKYHMTDIQASLGIHQLKKIKHFLKVRKELATLYDQEFKKINEVTTPYHSINSTPTHNIYPILININNIKINRNDIVEELKKYNIGSNVFFRPLHMQPFFKRKFLYKDGDFPISEAVFQKILCIPLFPGMTERDVSYVVNILKFIIEKNLKK